MADKGIFVPPPVRKSGPPTLAGLSMAQAKHEAQEEAVRQSTLAPSAEEVAEAAAEMEVIPVPPRKDEAPKELEPFPGPEEHVCSRCGFPRINSTTDMQPTAAEKDAYWRHVLGEPRFRRTYKELLGGRIEVTLRTRTVEESDKLGDLFRTELEGLSAVWRLSQSASQLDFRKTRLMLCASLEQVVIRFTKSEEGKVVKFPELPDLQEKTIRDRALAIQKAFPAEVTYAVLTSCLRHFESFCWLLSGHVADPSFFGEIDAGP